MLQTLVRFRDHNRQTPALLWAFAYFFCLLTGYYLLRPVREAMGADSDVRAVFPAALVDWFAVRGVSLGEFTLQFLFTCTFILMVLLQPVYGMLVSRYARRVFLPAVYGFFILCLLAFHVVFESALPGRGMAFFLWLTVFNLFAVAVFWSFMADVFSNTDAKRVYGYIGAGGTLGAMLGPLLTRTLVEAIGIGQLLLVSAAFLIVCLLCILRLQPWAVAREREQNLASGEVPMGGGVLAGLRLVAREPLLRAIAILVFFGVGIGTLLYNEQAAIARAYFTDAASRTAYYAGIDLAVNGLTLLVQLLLTRWLLTRHGIGPALLIPAFAILIGFAALAASPFPLLVAAVQVVTRASEFSLAKPARETVYTRVPREWRYKAGAAIDTAIYRGGDLTFVWLHKALSVLGSGAVFLTGMAVTAGMAFGAWRLVREQSKLPDERPAAGG